MIDKEQHILLTEIFGKPLESKLKTELFYIIKRHTAFDEQALIMADEIYDHLQNNVLRLTDLMNYENNND